MMDYKAAFLLFGMVFLPVVLLADNDYHPVELKALKAAGRICSLERILQQLERYGIYRLLEVELKENKDHPDNSDYLYEIEYIGPGGRVLELEVDALTTEVMHLDEESVSEEKD
jgi:uncharacterized membrane protein YkoI